MQKDRVSSFITHCSIALTEVCNLSCSYCYKHRDDLRKASMDFDTGIKVIDFLFGVTGKRFSINYFGGEPFCSAELMYRLTEYAADRARREGREILFSVNTNGTIMNEDVLLFIDKYRVRIILSIDGLPSAHDRHRFLSDGSGSYVLLQKNLPFFLKRYKRVHARMTVTPDNLDNMIEGVWHVYGLGFPSLAIAIDRCDEGWNLDTMKVFEENYVKIAEQYVTLLEDEDEDFRLVDLDRGAVGLDFPSSGTESSCGAAVTGIGVAVDGKIYPCYRFVGMEGFDVGNVYEGFDEVKTMKFLQNAFEGKGCSECESVMYCHRCPWVSYIKTKDLSLPAEINCLETMAVRRAFEVVNRWTADRKCASFNKRRDEIIRRFFRNSKESSLEVKSG